jgi:hypothetical protein
VTGLSNSERVGAEHHDKGLAKTRIAELVQKWRNVNSETGHKREDFSEEDTATKFIRPFFEVLGWNFSDIDEVMEQVTLPDMKRGQHLDCVLYLRSRPFAVIEYKPLIGSGSVDTPYNLEYVKKAARKLGAKYAILTRFSEMMIVTLESLEKHSFEVLAKSDYEEKFKSLWNMLSKESATKTLLEPTHS